MALAFFSGFEMGTFAEWDLSGGGVSMEESQIHTGAYSAKFTPTAGNADYVRNGGNYKRLSFWLYIVSASSGGGALTYEGGSWHVGLNGSRKLVIGEAGIERATGDTVMPLNTWIRISMTVNDSDGHCYVFYNGAAEVDYDGTYTQLGGGMYIQATGSALEMYVDDFVADNATGSTDDIGDIRCKRAALPDTDKLIEYDIFNPSDPGTGSRYTLIDDAPGSLSTTDNIGYADKANVVIEFYHESYSDIGLISTDVIDAVRLACYYQLSKDGGSVPYLCLNEGAYADCKAVTDTDGAWIWDFLLDTDAPDEAGWTLAKFDGLFSEFQHQAGEAVDDYVANLLILVAYHSGVAPTELELRSSTDTEARIALSGTEIALELRSATDTDARIALQVAFAITLELRSATDTDARIALNTTIAPELRSATDTDARISLDTGIGLALRSVTDTDARIVLDITTPLELRSSTGTRADIALEAGIGIELRSSTNTRADVSLQTAISLSLRSSTDTRADLALDTTIAPALRSLTDTDARLALDTGITLELRSFTDTDARLTIEVTPQLELRSVSDTDARLALDTEITLSLRSATDTRADLAIATIPQLALRSSTDTRTAIVLDTEITLALRSSTDTRADIELTVTAITYLELRSSTDTRADLLLDTTVSAELRSSSDTDARLALISAAALSLYSQTATRAALTLSAAIQLILASSTGTRAAISLTLPEAISLQLASLTATRAAIQLDTLIALMLRSSTATRAALILEMIIRHQDIIMEMQDRTLTVAMPARELTTSLHSRTMSDFEVRQNE